MASSLPNSQPQTASSPDALKDDGVVLDGISELIFLDRYAMKDPHKQINPGDTVVVLVKEDPRFPQKDVGIVRSVDGDRITIELKSSGELFVQDRKKVDKPLELRPEDMWQRLAQGAVAVEPAEKQAELKREFLWLLDDFRFSPGGRINAMLGTQQNLTAYNCYVIPIRCDTGGGIDSRQAIIDTLGNMVEIMSRGGGVGINLSPLRPRLSYVAGVNGRSSGSVSWGALFSFATGLVEQGGSRRGALMLVLEDWHPDLLEFITAKRDMQAINNANISVAISKAFMKAVKEDADWDLVFPDTQDPEYDELWDGSIKRWREKGKPVKVHRTLKAREIWDTIMESAWMSAEPGVVFLERMNELSNSWYFEDLICTNPCGEQPLPAWGVCNLGHINLSRFAVGPVGEASLDWDSLRRAVHGGVRFLDNVIDITPYFFPHNEDVQKGQRRIGMGTMGLGELLIRIGKRYGSPESLEFIDELYRFIATEAYLASSELAAEKGSFPRFDKEKYLQGGFIKRLPEDVREHIREHGMRNVCVLTQAPTGSTGTMIGTSTGIEPYYSWTYWRKGRLGTKEVQERIVAEYFDQHPGLDRRLDNLPDYFVSALELTPKEHIQVQAAIQTWTDSSISKTANAPNNYTIEQTKELYEYAYELGCKGVTIYRDGSRDEQVLTKKEEKETEEATVEVAASAQQSPAPDLSIPPKERRWPGRPHKLTGATYEWLTPLGKAFITVNEYQGDPIEIFINIGKAGSDISAMSEALGRLATLFLKHAEMRTADDKVQMLVKHLSDIGGSTSVGFGINRISSVPDALAKTLKVHLEDSQRSQGIQVTIDFGSGMDLCPTCGIAALAREEGCFVCKACGYTKC